MYTESLQDTFIVSREEVQSPQPLASLSGKRVLTHSTPGGWSSQLRLHHFTAPKQQGLNIRERTFITNICLILSLLLVPRTPCHWLMQVLFMPFLSSASAKLQLLKAILGLHPLRKHPFPCSGKKGLGSGFTLLLSKL